MAVATKNVGKVKKMVEVEVEEVKNVTLVLSVEEAKTLRLICGLVCGHNYNSPRKHTDAIYYALEEFNVENHVAYDFLNNYHISFRDDTLKLFNDEK